MTLLFLLCVLKAASLSSQDVPAHQTDPLLNLRKGVTFDNRYEGVRGSPYIFSEYKKAEVFFENESVHKIDLLNYNRYSSELCYKVANDEQVVLLNQYLIDSFLVYSGEESQTFVRLKLDKNADYVYLECLYRGESILYLDHCKAFIKADYADTYSSDRRYDEFKDLPVYYIQLKEGDELLALRKGRKQNSELFENHSEKMMEFFKVQKTSFDNRRDLILMMQFYDDLPE